MNAMTRLSFRLVAFVLVAVTSFSPGYRLEPTQSTESEDAIVSDFSNYEWHTFFGSSNEDAAEDIAVDEDGNIYLAGWSKDTWVGPGSSLPLHAHSGAGNQDIIVIKLNSSGEYQWHTFYGSISEDKAFEIDLDSSGNVYVCGQSFDTWLGDWIDDHYAEPLHDHSGSLDTFILKLNSSGMYQWHTFYGSSNQDLYGAIDVDLNGNVYAAASAYISWQGNEDSSPLHAHAGGGWRDLAVIKMDSEGAYQWHTFYGSTGDDMAYAIAVGENGESYVTGFSNSSWLGFGDAIPLRSHAGGYEIVLLKLNDSGEYEWHTFYGSSSYDVGEGIEVDAASVYLAGYSYAGWLGDAGKPPLHDSSNDGDILVLKLDLEGNYIWHTFYGPSGHGYSVSVDDSGLSIAATSGTTWNGDDNTLPRHANNGGLTLLKLNHNGIYKWHTFYGSSYGGVWGYAVSSYNNQYACLAGMSMNSWLGDEATEPLNAYTGDRDIVALSLTQSDAEEDVDSLLGGELYFPITDDSYYQVTVPSNAVENEVTLKLTEVGIVDPEGEMAPAGMAFDLEAFNGDTHLEGFEFLLPVEVTLAYEDKFIAGLDESSLVLYYWDDGTQAWTDAAETCDPNSEYTREPENNRLSVAICHLSRFAMLGFPSSTNWNFYLPIVVR